jgi:polar amino acid transport system substrate-binding protein
MRYVLAVTFTLLLSTGAWAEVLRVGLSADYPPVHFKQDGRIVGIEVDNSRAVGEFIGRRVKLVELPFDQLIPALVAGEIDVIMSGMSVTSQRAEKVTFTDPYMRVGQMAIMHRDKVGQFSQPWSVYREGVRIGVEPGTTGAAFAERELKDALVSYFDDPAAAFDGLRQDKIDLYIHDAPTSWQLANSTQNSDLLSLYSPLTEEMLAWAVRPEDVALAGELNRALQVMKSNGTLQYILNRWIPVKIEVQ